MATLSTIIKRDLSTMGKFLFIGAIMVLVAGIANIWLQSSALMITLSVLVIGIFSAFIVYDLQRVKNGLETNYITATLGVYLSLYNVFSALLSIFGLTGGPRIRRFAKRRRFAESTRPRSGPCSFWVSGSVEDRDALDVGGVREHVDRTGRAAAVAGAMDEQPGVAGQRRRVAAHVDDPPRRRPAGDRLLGAGRPAPWRSRTRLRAADRPASGRPGRSPPGSPASPRTGCAPRTGSARRACSSAAASRARAISAALPSIPSTDAARVASGRVKLPRPQNQSITRSPGCGREQAHARATPAPG